MTPPRALLVTAVSSIVVSLLLAASVLGSPSTRLFGFELVGRHHDPFVVMAQYAAGAIPTPYLQPVTDLPGIALAALVGPLAAYNALVLLTFPLTAVIAFVHARHVISSPGGALVAALLFTLAPFHIAQSAYHVHIAQVQWLPLFFFTLWRLVEHPGARGAVAVAASLLLVGASSFYFGFIAAVIAPPAAIAWVWLAPRSAAASRRAALAWTAATLIATLAAALLAAWVAAPQTLQQPGVFAFPKEALDEHSARWWSYLLPPAAHPWLGSSSAALWRSAGISVGLLEQQVSIGLGVLALAIVPLVASGAHPWRWRAQALALTGVAAALCSLPPAGPSGAMPSSLLYELAPMFRAYARFGVVVSLMLTTLAGAGFALLMSRGSRRTSTLAIGLLILAAVEYWPAQPLSRDVLPTTAHRWLAGRAGVRVLDCVVPTPGETEGVGWLMGVDISVAAGPLADCGDAEIASTLTAFGYTHLLVRRASPTGQWLASGGVISETRAVYEAGDAAVYAVDAVPPLLYTADLTGFYPREYRGPLAWRWMDGAGAATVINRSPGDLSCILELDLEAFAAARRLHITADQHEVARIDVPPERTIRRVGPLTLAPGMHTVGLAADATLVPAARDPGSSDRRPLAIRVFHSRWQCEAAPPPAP